MSEVVKSREAQLAEGSTIYGQISQLKGWYQHLPSKPYPQTLEAAGVKIRRQEEPTVKGGQQVELVSIVTKGLSNLTLCQDGRILVNGYDDVQSIDSDAYAQAISSLKTAIGAIAKEADEDTNAKRGDVRKQLSGFLEA
ncbi:MAG: hypothetical protein WC608_05825 [Parcubacteria group bacterium]